MSRLKTQQALLSFGLAVLVNSVSLAQNASIRETNLHPSPHRVDLVPRVPVSAADATQDQPNRQAVDLTCREQGRPTIIVRPASFGRGCLNECELDVEPIGPAADNRYRLKLSIPESVEIIELLPQRSGELGRQVRVLIDSPTMLDDLAATSKPAQETTRTPDATTRGEQLVSNRTVVSMFQANPFFSEISSAAEQSDTGVAKAAIDDNAWVPSPFRLSSAQSRRRAAELVPDTTFLLESTIIGPRSLATGATAEFEINLRNSSTNDYQDLLVQLQLPEGFEPLLLDRSVWLDKSRRTVSWKLDELKSGQSEVIHYAVVATVAGTQIQNVTIGMDGRSHGVAEIQTLTTSPF